MQILITAIVFVLIFSMLIFIHELGHFTAAKRAGVKVEEFGFGLPPRMWGVKKGETIYSINWIPFGGFVRMLGEDGSKRASRSQRNFANQPLRTQAWIVCAGVVMNLLLAFLLLTLGFLLGMEPLIADQDDFLAAVKEGTVELEPGWVEGDEGPVFLSRMTYLEDSDSLFADVLEDGDVILRVNGEEVLTSEDIVSAFDHQETAALTVWREGELIEYDQFILPVHYPIVTFVEEGSPADLIGIVPSDQIMTIGYEPVLQASEVIEANAEFANELGVHYQILREGTVYDFQIQLTDEGRVGIGISDLSPYYGALSLYSSPVQHKMVEIHEVQYGLASPKVAAVEMVRLGKLTGAMFVNVLGQFLSGGSVPEGVAGPVGIAQMTHVNLQNGFTAMLRFVALLSLSLGVINILPIPALDGGRLVFILYQGITGHKPNPRIEHLIHMGGFLLLLAFIAYVTFNDVLNLF